MRPLALLAALLGWVLVLAGCDLPPPPDRAATLISVGPTQRVGDDLKVAYTLLDPEEQPLLLEVSICTGGLRCRNLECLPAVALAPRANPFLTHGGSTMPLTPSTFTWRPGCEVSRRFIDQWFSLCLAPEQGEPMESGPLSLHELGFELSNVDCDSLH